MLVDDESNRPSGLDDFITAIVQPWDGMFSSAASLRMLFVVI